MSIGRNRHQSRRSGQLERKAARQTRHLAEGKAVARPEPDDSTPSVDDTPTTDSNPEVEA
ncbi:hypothetical protein [Natrinema gelatinilyticum]|uniref:hypothetical protein n=1 Tax=Natrinema gelatinilyticum TaxID=2961571 RepID=UPI0020C5A62E|nr:hypothetical protein [Natrinema gelatinilyticum]